MKKRWESLCIWWDKTKNKEIKDNVKKEDD